MRVRRISQTTLAIVPALLLAASACSKGMSGTTSESVVAGPDGAIVTETFSTTATIVAIDQAKMKLTLQTPDGKKTSFKASPSMTNFPQLRVGDVVNAVVTEQVAIAIWKGSNPPADAAAAMVGITPTGSQNPAGFAVATEMITAQITAIDAAKRKVTVQFQDGSTKTYKAQKGVDLTQVQVGDNITLQVTEGAAITVTKQ
ncbi:MAG TPA: hypothetical protein PK948_08650 [Gemmatimonadales bacterium]|nr:hypothetical protein [Gemmatimonadales bacterium]